MIMPHHLAARVLKPVGMFGIGHFTITPPSHRNSKQNGRLIYHRRSTRRNRFATDAGAASKETVGLINSAWDRAPLPVPEVD
jgi:hypothetical protein